MNMPENLPTPRARKLLAVAACFLVFWAVMGFLVLPAVLRPVVERKIGEALHRKAALAGMSINPFTLSVSLQGLDVKDRDGTSPFLSFERLYVNPEVSSVFRRGPILRAVALVKPAVTLVRNADATYSVQDLLEEYSKPRPKDERPLRLLRQQHPGLGRQRRLRRPPEETKHAVRDVLIGIPSSRTSRPRSRSRRNPSSRRR